MPKTRMRAIVIAGFSALVLAAGVPAYAADAPPATQDAAQSAALQAIENAGPEATPIEGPQRVVTAADGSVEVFAAAEPVNALAASDDECGNACDGKDPASYLVQAPGGPSHYYYCATDAKTIYTKKSSDGKLWAQLRYSPRCRTAWTKGCCYTSYAGFSYKANGTERQNVTGGSPSTPNTYTAMLNDAGYTYKACYNRVVSGEGADWQCTSKY